MTVDFETGYALKQFMGDRWHTRMTLLERVRDKNDEQAWSEFISYYKSFIEVVLHQMNYRGADFEDVVQEVLLKIWQNLNRYEKDFSKARFRTWLGVLIRNRVLDHIKSKKRFERRNDQAVDEMMIDKNFNVSQPDVNEIVEKEWVRHITMRALKNVRPLFSGKAIEVFELSLSGLSSEEIAKRTELKVNSVHKLRARVQVRLVEEIKQLRKKLERA